MVLSGLVNKSISKMSTLGVMEVFAASSATGFWRTICHVEFTAGCQVLFNSGGYGYGELDGGDEVVPWPGLWL